MYRQSPVRHVVAALMATSAALPAFADEAADSGGLESVVISARNRTEKAQDVPLPIEVLGSEKLEREDIKNIYDLPLVMPNLVITGNNARNISPRLRGLGGGGTGDSMERSLGFIVDGVTLYYTGQAWSEYADVERIEVLRGPQGTLMGKNTTLGAVNIVTKGPSFQNATNFEVSAGELNALGAKVSATGPILDDVLAWRGSFLVDRQDGVYTNTYQSMGHAKETWRETNKLSGRLQFLWTPSDTLRGRFILDKLRSDERINTGTVTVSNGPQNFYDGTPRPITNPIGYTPTGSYVNYGYLGKWAERAAWFHNADGSVYQPLLNTTDIENSEARPQITDQYGLSAQFDWQLSGHTLTSISAYRYQDFDIKNGGQNGPYYIGNSGQQLWNDQISQELRLTSNPGRTVDYQLGLYYLDAEVYSDDPSYYGQDAGAWNATTAQYTTLIARAAGRELLRKSLDGMYQSSVTDATVQSLALYGQTDWHVSDRGTVTLGLRQTEEKKQNKISQQLDRAGENLDDFGAALGATTAEINAAKAVRSRQITAAFDWVEGNDIKSSLTAWNAGYSFKLNDDVLLYSSVGLGIKSGFIFFQQQRQPTDPDFETDLKPEKSLDFELGFKSQILSNRLQLNVNLYQTRLTDYQASWTRDNPITPGTTITGWGNAPKVLARGVEFETAFQFTPSLSSTLTGAYNRATYEAQWLVQRPGLSTTILFDANGEQIANVPKTGLNHTLNWDFPVHGFLGRVTFTNSYRSGAYLSDSHDPFTYQKAQTVSNFGIGFGSESRSWELSLLVKNLFDVDYATTRSQWSATAPESMIIGAPRQALVVFRGKF